MAFTRPHFRQPFARGSYVEQDTPEHVQSCWFTIAACATGARAERPEFGWDQPLLRTMPLNANGLVAALRQHEPREPNVTAQQAESVFGEVIEVGVALTPMAPLVAEATAALPVIYEGGAAAGPVDTFIDGGVAATDAFDTSLDGKGAPA